ncbi:DUF5839 family protein [Clostridium perfringens]|jgi:hypothetical protein|uniref:DUF5839 family protein n=1 Tax=Clostridium perfringens TaxID=1502 RepID=UPI001ABAD9E2|nr:DUF5839 family protein [Clostridium perfringens]MBO3366391.1 hypothetical protein [Clostridium perfringens]MBO3383409.1 hypothetical protein [Clostridium perfringens]
MKIIKGMHIYKNKDGSFYIRGNKLYTWEVSKKLEEKNIEQGDIVLAECKNTKAPVIVLNVLEISQEKKKYKKIIKILEKNKK